MMASGCVPDAEADSTADSEGEEEKIDTSVEKKPTKQLGKEGKHPKRRKKKCV